MVLVVEENKDNIFHLSLLPLCVSSGRADCIMFNNNKKKYIKVHMSKISLASGDMWEYIGYTRIMV